MSESCEIYIKPPVACNLIQVGVALEGHMLPAGSPEHMCITAEHMLPSHLHMQSTSLSPTQYLQNKHNTTSEATLNNSTRLIGSFPHDDIQIAHGRCLAVHQLPKSLTS